MINFQRYALGYALQTVDSSVIYALGCTPRTAVRFCLWLCAGKYALTQERKPGEATGKASRRPEGCPRGQIDTLGYAQGYALPKGQPGETDTSNYENVHSNFNFSIGRLYFLRCSVYGGGSVGAAAPPARCSNIFLSIVWVVSGFWFLVSLIKVGFW